MEQKHFNVLLSYYIIIFRDNDFFFRLYRLSTDVATLSSFSHNPQSKPGFSLNPEH